MSILPFPSILDDIKEKGFKKAVFEGVDRTVERITAGMNVQDIREALRGEAPSRRPNPRLQPHADAFWMHMRPSFFHRDMTGVYPTFRLGWLSTYFVFFETITGIFLMVWYTPSPDVAYANMLNIMGNVPFGQFMRDLHRLGAEMMVLVVWLHMLRTFLTGSYKKPRQFTWFTGIVLLFATMFLSFSGYLLPWDQLALWAVTIGASMIEATPPPVVGENLNLLLRGGPEIGANGLLRFYLLHVLAVPALLFIFTGVHYYKVIVHGHSLPPKSENIGEDTAKRVPLEKRVYFIPDVLTSEIMWIAVTTFLMVVLCVWFYHAPLETHADPQITPLGTTAPWYFLWIQGALKLGDKVIWGIVFPTIVLVGLAVIPYIDTTPSRRYADRRFMLSFSFFFISAMTVLSYMGLPEYGVASSAENHIMHEMIKEPAHNHMGLLLPVPFDQLATGAYVTREIDAEGENAEAAVAAFNEELRAVMISNGETGDLNRTGTTGDFLGEQLVAGYLAPQYRNPRFTTIPSDSPQLHHAMERFAEMLHHDDKELYNAWGAVIITDEQVNMKRLDVIISWDQVELNDTGAVVLDASGEPIPVLDENGVQIRRWYVDHIFINENSAYFE
jgi:quinol-cytochrome oxidoreductase complex cytochrome b subunit